MMKLNKPAKTTVHLQYCGDYLGTPASELKVGDKMMWNNGYITTVMTIEKRGKSVYVTEKSTYGGKETLYERRFLATRLVVRV